MGLIRPPRRKRRRQWLVWIAIAVVTPAAFAGLIALGMTNPIREAARIRAVEITASDTGAIDAGELRARLPIRAGDSFLDVHTRAIERALTADPHVAAVDVRYAWFHRLVVAVSERKAVAAIMQPRGERFEIAADGVLLEPATAMGADLPLLTWEGQAWPSDWRAGAICDLRGAPDLLALLAQLQTDGRGLWSCISEAHLHGDGSAEIFWNDAPIVAWTRGSLSPLRIHAWAAVMADLARRGERDAVVDLRYREQIVVRLPKAAAEEPQDRG
jgi:cell division septal protein FtsQ